MTSRELFEMASLDVMGLLDEQERSAFEDAFRAAPPHVQAQIRAEQLRFADGSGILPSVEPPVGLKAKVVAAVRDAIAQVRPEPIARIGAGGRLISTMPIWRAACIGFATASLVLGLFSWSVSQQNRRITEAFVSGVIIDQFIQSSGAQFTDMLTRPTVKHVSFVPAAKDFDGRASAAVYVDESTSQGYLVCNDLSAGQTYRLVVEGADGSRVQLKEFEASTSGTIFVPLQSVSVQSMPQMKLQTPRNGGKSPESLLVASGV